MRAKVFLIILAMSLFFVGQVIGQGHQVTGRVVGQEDRGPLLGLNIVVKNTERGTSTDNDGRYVLENVSPQDTLVFLYIGYQKEEVPVGDRKVIDIIMTPQAVAGEEVVVVGYGTQIRKNITSSISSLDEHAFTEGAISDPQTLLQARIPGVLVTQSNGDVGAAPLIRIRGGTSVSAGNEPLIVIDGVPIDNSSTLPSINVDVISGTRDNALSMLNPNDIASIDVLKDASAAAIYGARGGNGVILITTKGGRAGGYSLTYDGYTSTSSQSKKLDLLTAQEYKDFAAQVGASPTMGTANTDWQDAIVRTAVSQNHSLSFSSSTKNSSYRVSLNYLDEQGIVLGSGRQRISARLNINQKALNGKLRLALRLNPTFIKRRNTPYQQTGGFEGGLFTNVYKMNPTQPVYSSDGSFFEYANPGIRNPVALLKNIKDDAKTMRVFVNATAEYDITPGLIGKINLGLDRTDASRNAYQPRSLPYAAAFGGRADVRSSERQNVLFESTLNYRKHISVSQSLEAWAGYTFQEFGNSRFGATARDFVTDAWSYNNLGGGADFIIRPFSFKEKNRLISLLGRVNYSLMNRYLLSVILRREGSSRFGSGKKWGTFPSASVGWRLSDEAFMQNMSKLSDLKLRLSYGITGNQDIGNYRSLVILGPGSNAVIGDQVLTGVSATQLANPDLKWEGTSQINFGIDFGFLNDRISGSIDLYKKTTTDLLLEFAVPQPAVVSTRLDNAGEVQNKGIEIALNTINKSSADLFWRSSLNFTTNSQEVVSLGKRDYIMTGRVSGAGLSGIQAQIILPGQPIGTFFGPKFLGYNSSGKERLSTDVGEESSTGGPLGDGRFILGNAQPDFTVGFSNMLKFKKWDFRLFVQAVQGFDILNNTRMEYQRPSNVFNGINLLAGALDDVAAGMDPEATTDFSDRFIENGSFIRLQNVTLGYTFDTQWVRNLRLYLSADNLFVITGYSGYDPEVNTFAAQGGVATLGMDYTNYPRARTITLGVSIGL